MRKIIIYSSKTESSLAVDDLLSEKIKNAGFTKTDVLSDDVELIVCIGGDGTFLEGVHRFGLPSVPFIGINTGHLGFFQEIMPDKIDLFLSEYVKGNYTIQTMRTVKAIVSHENKFDEHIGLNEIAVRNPAPYSAHLNISIGGGFIEKFSGDGVLISTSAGSTAYNYSLGGSIVDPRIELIQVTPIAPMNTTAYRSFTSSILLPPDLSIEIEPDRGINRETLLLTYDGVAVEYDNVDSIQVTLSDTPIHLLRFSTYDFWTKVKSKFL